MSQHKQKVGTGSLPAHQPLPLGTLRASFISRLLYEMLPGWTPKEAKKPASIDLVTSVDGPPNEGTREVTVSVRIRDEEGHDDAYRINIEAVTIIDELPADALKTDLDLHAIRVGAPIAYGLIRETLISLSARGPYPRIVLPLVPLTAFTSEATPPPP